MSRPGVRVALAGAAILLVTGCTGSPSDPAAWRDTSDKTVGQAIAGLGTAKVIAQQVEKDRLPHAYAVVSASEAVDTTVKEIRSYVGTQPPDRMHGPHAAVVAALVDALQLLVEARTTLASPEPSSQALHELVDRLTAASDKLDQLSQGLTATPTPEPAS
jgi:uncharacterized membrane protein YccC